MPKAVQTAAPETFDGLFGGRLKIWQSRSGYRVSIDALLLADFVSPRGGERVVELGTGNGVVCLALALWHRAITLTGVELQAAVAERARRNVALNALADRIRIVEGDVRTPKRWAAAESFDVALCNPPYRRAGSGRISGDNERRIARHETSGGLREFVAAAAFLLRNKGRWACIYPAERTADVLCLMRNSRIEPKRLRMVHSFLQSPACLVLVEGVKHGRSGLVVQEPLAIYREGKKYSQEAAAIIAGEGVRGG
jgi:tRNA1Val (adenine37-N6)-methyltransferase